MLRGALVGAGRMGQLHLRKLAAREDVEVVAVVDPKADRTDGVLWKDSVPDEVDFAVVASPSHTHFQIAKDLLERGIPCLVEKPLATTASEVHNLQHFDCLSVHQVERFNPALEVLPDPLHLTYFKSNRLAAWTSRGTDVDVLLDLMIHDLDLFLYWVDSPVVEVRACGVSVKSDGLDVVEAWLETESGVVGTFCASRLSQKKERTLRLVDRESYWKIDLASGASHSVDWRAGDTKPVALLEPSGDSIERFHDAFFAAVEKRRPYPCPASEAFATLSILEKIRLAVRKQ